MDHFLSVFRHSTEKAALTWRNDSYSFGWLLEELEGWRERFVAAGVKTGSVVALQIASPPESVAALLAGFAHGCIMVPLGSMPPRQLEQSLEIAQAEWRVTFPTAQDGISPSCLASTGQTAAHPHYFNLRERHTAGLVLFSSGSEGKRKASVLDLSRLLSKYRTPRHNLRTLAFLLLDHIGGVDTLFYALSNRSCLVFPEERTVEGICTEVERHRVEVLPVTPSFLNLLLLSDAHLRYDLSSLKWITYGAETMPESTLERCVRNFPGVRFLQKYGTTEVGTLRSQSRDSGSVWVRIGGEGYQTRVIDGILQIKAESVMLGYLNAPSPFTEDGWFDTGDEVAVDGEFLKILGRRSDRINVGGQKVFPGEVESVIRELPEVESVVVSGEANPLLGQIVCARVVLTPDTEPGPFRDRLIQYCRERLEPFKVPVRVLFDETPRLTERFKLVRDRGDRA